MLSFWLHVQNCSPPQKKQTNKQTIKKSQVPIPSAVVVATVSLGLRSSYWLGLGLCARCKA